MRPFFHNPRQALIMGICALLVIGCNSTISTDPAQSSSLPSLGASNPSEANVPGANLANDALNAPPAPALTIAATVDGLHFSWPLAEQSVSTNLYQMNSRTRLEQKLNADLTPATTEYLLAVDVHRLAWNDLLYRVEQCDTSDCVSSAYVSIAGQFTSAITTLRADEPVSGNGFGQALAINSNGNVGLIAAPGNQAVYVYFQLPNGWIQGSHLQLQEAAPTRISELQVAMSASGDTLALLLFYESKLINPTVRIYDRLGENWIQTASISPLDATTDNPAVGWRSDSAGLKMSLNGERILIGLQQLQPVSDPPNTEAEVLVDLVAVYDRTAVTWQRAATISLPAAHQRLPAISGSDDLQTIHLLSKSNTADVQLHEYQFTGPHWQLRHSQTISMLQPTRDLSLVTHSNGLHFVVAGWESGSTQQRTPVAWRYDSTDPNTLATWQATDSLRLAPTSSPKARLQLAADGDLDIMILGWWNEATADMSGYSRQNSRWKTSFRWPTEINNRQTQISGIAVSRDGSTVMLGTNQHPANNTGGTVHVLQ